MKHKQKLAVLAVMILGLGLLSGCTGKQLTSELNTTPPEGHPVYSF
jgi:outer membrane murein-binding lipoprotein Lpp